MYNTIQQKLKLYHKLILTNSWVNRSSFQQTENWKNLTWYMSLKSLQPTYCCHVNGRYREQRNNKIHTVHLTKSFHFCRILSSIRSTLPAAANLRNGLKIFNYLIKINMDLNNTIVSSICITCSIYKQWNMYMDILIVNT